MATAKLAKAAAAAAKAAAAAAEAAAAAAEAAAAAVAVALSAAQHRGGHRKGWLHEDIEIDRVCHSPEPITERHLKGLRGADDGAAQALAAQGAVHRGGLGRGGDHRKRRALQRVASEGQEDAVFAALRRLPLAGIRAIAIILDPGAHACRPADVRDEPQAGLRQPRACVCVDDLDQKACGLAHTSLFEASA